MILAPCPVGFWRTSALIRQILVLRYCGCVPHALQDTSCGFYYTEVRDVPTDPYPSC